MRHLTLDYAPRPVWANRAGLAALTLSLAAAAGLATVYHQEAGRHAAWQVQWQQLERWHKRTAGSPPSAAADRQLQLQIRRANEVTAQLDLPWGALFEAVESASHETVALLGIQPDPQKRTVSIAAESRDMSAALDYVKRLLNNSTLSEVHMVSHQVQEQDPDKPLQFSVLATWRDVKRDK